MLAVVVLGRDVSNLAGYDDPEPREALVRAVARGDLADPPMPLDNPDSAICRPAVQCPAPIVVPPGRVIGCINPPRMSKAIHAEPVETLRPSRAPIFDATPDRRVACAAAFDRWAAVLNGLIFAITGSRDRASDLLVEVFAEFWAEPDRGGLRIDDPEVLAGLVSLARRKALRALDGDGAGSVEERPPRLYLPDSVMARMPPVRRRVIELAFCDGLSPQQIAEYLEVQESWVSDALDHGLQDIAAGSE